MKSTTFRVYPRPDQEYKKKDSIDFQMQKSAIYQTRPDNSYVTFYKWCAYALTGVITGLVCFVWEVGVESLVEIKWKAAQSVLQDTFGEIFGSYAIYIALSLFFGMSASILTLKIEPLAAGGGTTEMMGYFNGVNYPGVFSFKTLIVKIFGLMFAIAAGLCIGKEGVLAHIGSIIGYAILYLPFGFLAYFRNPEDKRDIAAAGTAAGVAAAFGSPIGGTMFAYEVAAPTVFWTFDLTWMLFFTSAISCFTVNICQSIENGSWDLTNAGVIKFGSFSDYKYQVQDLISFAIIGVIGGLLGSFFCYINYRMSVLRKKYLTNNMKKFLETSFFVFITGSFMFFAPMLIKNECFSSTIDPDDPQQESASEHYQRYLCPEGTYSPLATALFNPLGSVFKLLMNPKVDFSVQSLVIYLIVWYPLTIFSYGTNIPAGLFVSGILIGSAYGRLVGLFVKNNINSDIEVASYAVVGAASILSGYARHTFSLAIIMMESTESINLFIPVSFAILIAYSVGRIFTRSIYINSVRFKNIPFLVEKAPEGTNYVTADTFMTENVVTLHIKPTVQEVQKVLKDTKHNGFPVVGQRKNILGIISRDYLYVLLQKKCWAAHEIRYQFSQVNVEQMQERTSLNSDYIKKRKFNNDKMNRTLSMKKKKMGDYSHLRENTLSQIDDTNEDGTEIEMDEIKDSLPVTWKDFNVGFYDLTPPYSCVDDICEEWPEKTLSLKPYMQHKPITAAPHDPLQKIVDLFRLHHLRYLPVVKDGEILVGIITRQDLFSYMSI